MKSALLKKYGTFEWTKVPVPEIEDDQVLIKTSYAGICGTDQHIFKGEFHPRTQPPFIPGHEFAGSIVKCGKNVNSFKEGQRVTVDPIIWCGKCAACAIGHYPACSNLKLLGVDLNGGFSEYAVANENQLYALNDAISDRDAALIEMLSIGFHACKRAELKKNDSLVIWGAGKVGQCILQAARTKTENTIFIIDQFENRLKIAEDNYENLVAININEDYPPEVVKEITNGRGVDVAIEAVGHFRDFPGKPHPVQGCIECIHGAGTVCVLGLSNEATSIMMKDLIWREARIIASRVSHGEFSETIRHLSMGHLKPQIMVSEVIAASKAQEAFQMLEKNPSDHLKILLDLSTTV